MKVGDLVKLKGVGDSRAGLIVEFMEKKCWRTDALGPKVNWDKIEPESHKVAWCGADTRAEQSRFLELVYATR